MNDITARKQTEEKLQDSEEYLQILFDYAPDAYYINDLKGNFIDGNKAAERLTGYKREELIGKSFLKLKLLSLADMPKAAKLLVKNLRGQPTGPDEFVLNRKDNSKVTVEISTYPVKIKGKTLALGIARDITERKQAEEVLKESEGKLRNIFENSTNLFYSHTPEHILTYLSPQVEDILGYTQKEAIIKWTKLTSDNPVNEIGFKYTVKAIETGKRQPPYELELVKKNGEKIWVEVREFPEIKDGKTITIIGSLTDITARKQAEEALLKALAQANEGKRTLDALMEQVPEGITIADAPDVRIRMVSRYGRELTGKSKEILEGITVDKHAQQWDIYCADGVTPAKNKDLPLTRATQKGELVKDEEWVLGNQFNERVPILCNAGPIRDEVGNITGGVIAWRDITELKQAEERIKHLNLVLRAIRNINQLIFQEKDRERLLKGVCNSLIKTRGYYHSQIVLLDEEGKIDSYAEADFGKDFLAMCTLLKKGELTVFGQMALKQRDVVIIKDPASVCPDCPLVQACSAKGSVMTIRLGRDGKIYGVMSVSIPAHFVTDKEEQALFKEVAADIVLGLHSIEMGKKLDKQTHYLKERVKELNCLWELSNLIEKSGISLEKIFQEIVNLLPAAWQYPEIACARIILEGKEYKTENFKETIWKQSGDIKIHKKIIGTLEVYYLEERPEIDEGPFQKEEGDLITVIAERLGEFIDGKKSMAQLQQSYQRTKRAMDATIETVSKIVEAKDPYTAGHQQRVSQLATAIAKELNFSKDKIEGIRIASLIHDIGKIGLPTEILSKPTKLSDIEFSLIKEHPQIGYNILKSIDFSYPVAQIILQHHERLDGSGYPNNLKGDKIFLEAKIIGIADVIEAMSSHRPYRPSLGIDAALEEISQNRGILYDPQVVDTCLKLFKEKGFKF